MGHKPEAVESDNINHISLSRMFWMQPMSQIAYHNVEATPTICTNSGSRNTTQKTIVFNILRVLLWIQQLQIVDTITEIEYKSHVTNVLDATIEENE